MKTVGKLLMDARTKKKYSRERLEKETKIKKEFIEFIEKEKWDDLPDFPVVAGFVSSISQVLGVNEKRIKAVLRRDYPPRTLPVNPNPDLSEKFAWSPKITFIVVSSLVTVIILGYLIFQYSRFINPPQLSIFQPIENLIVDDNLVKVVGRTDQDATIKVNNQPVLVDDQGNFSVEIEISEETKEIFVEAVSRSGKVTKESRMIETRLEM